MAQMAVPVRPLPALQWTTKMLSLSATIIWLDTISIVLTRNPLKSKCTNLKEKGKRWRMTIVPFEVSDPPFEVFLFVIRRPF